MNKQRITEIISAPGNLNYDSDYPLVKELIESFPYFSTPHVMLSKMLYDENSIYFDKNLKISAAYIGNREILYNYIHEKHEKIQPEFQEITEAPVALIEQKPAILVEEASIEKIIVAEPAQIVDTIDEKPLQAEPVHEEPIAEEPALLVQPEVSEEPSETEQPEVIQQQAVSEKPEVSEEKEFTPIAKNINHFHDFGNEILQYPITDYFSQLYKKEQKAIQEKEILARENAGALTGKKSFSDWLTTLENQKKAAPKEMPIPRAEQKQTDHSNVNELINKFIQAEPKIKPQQSRMYKPEDMAKLSVKEDHNIATETLANIYVKQGLKSRAVEIFQQLILKYPEKSDYFAGKIKEIQTEGSF